MTSVNEAIAYAKAFEKKVEGVDSPWDIILNPFLADHIMDWAVNAAKDGYLNPKASKIFKTLDIAETGGQAAALTGVLMSMVGTLGKNYLEKFFGDALAVSGGGIWGSSQTIGALYAWSQMTNDLNDVNPGQDKFFWGDDTSETGLEKDYV